MQKLEIDILSEEDTNTVTNSKSVTIDGVDKHLLSYTYNTYDSMGRTLSTADQSGDSTEYAYDVLGNVTMETTTTGSKQAITINTYDCTGQQLSTRTDKYTKNEEGDFELTTTGVTTSYTYDLSGRVLTETLSQGENSVTTNTYAYDLVENNLLKNTTTDANGRVQSRYYDILGQIVEEEKGGIAVRYAYDAQGRMISASRYRVSAGIGGEETVTTRYTYDSYGRQSTIDYGTHKVSFTYDLNDNVLSESRLSNDGTVENTTSYTYDENGNVLTVTRNGETITFGYNGEGSSTSVVYDDISMSWSYDDNGNVNEASVTKYMENASSKSYWRNYYYIDGQPTTVLEYRNASYYIFRNYGYDDEGNLTVLNHGNRNYGWDEQHSVTYDDEGRIATEKNIINYVVINNEEYISDTITKSYNYDWLGRLATETVDGVVTTYTYDNVGNIRTKTTGDITTTYNYNTLDQLQNIQTSDGVIQASYTYDLSGNRATVTSYGNTVTYTYDGQNNMTSSGGITYTYDANGERLTKTAGLNTYSYYYDGVNLLFTKKNGAYENQYLYDNGEIFGAVDENDVAYWYCYDIRGSITKVMKGDTNTSISTTLDTSYVYNAYGDTTTTTAEGCTFRNDIAYTGAIIDQETGLYYLMSRYYDPSIGQFISEDSYRGDGEAFWHLYTYCDGDPVNNTDRDGFKPKSISVYNSERSAAIAFANKMLPKTRANAGLKSIEYGSYILRINTDKALNLDGLYIKKGNKGKYFLTPIINGKHNVVHLGAYYNLYSGRWKNVSWKAGIHSHPACACHNIRKFSQGDRDFFKAYSKITSFYVAVPAFIYCDKKYNQFSRYDELFKLNIPSGKQLLVWNRRIY